MPLEAPYSYSYPTHRTGTAQDLMSVVTRAYELHLQRSRTILPQKADWQRLLFEAPFVLLGLAVSRLVELVPADWSLAGHDKLFEALSGPRRYRFEEASPVLERARALAARAEDACGQRPALLALISHPPVMGELAHLNFALVRQAILALRAVRSRPCRPRLVVATDFFALDTIPLYQEGIYAGFMGDYHLGFDRLAFSRKLPSRCLLRKAAWDRTAYRLLGSLGRGGEVGLVLAGGVPATTRVLYAVREWLGAVRRRSPLRRSPAEVLARLRADADFARFEKLAPLGARLSLSAWRLAEAWAMAALAGVFLGGGEDGEAGADAGVLTGSAREALARALAAFGLSAPAREKALDELADELGRETPYRRRFFELLAGRVLKAGRPVVIVPVAHRVKPQLCVEVREAWSLTGVSGGAVRAELPGGASWKGSPADFAVRFVRENFE